MRERASAVKVPFTLYKMLFASFINWYLLAQFLGILVVVIADLFGQLDMYLSKNLSALEILKLSHFSRVQLFGTLWTTARQAPLSM